MAVMSEADRVAAWEKWMRDNEVGCSFTHQQLRAAVDAVDGWISDNAAGYNSALPLAFRTGATTAQKAFLLMVVAGRRYEVGT